MKKVLLIVNPRAGKCKGAKHLSEIIHILQRGGYMSMVFITEKAGDAKQFVYDHIGEFDSVICVGGDGTFSEVVTSMVSGKHCKPIGYIPAGSTNDFAASLHLSYDLSSAAYDIINGVPKEFDVGCFNGHPFAYIAAFGIFAKTSYDTPQELKNALGHLAYVLEGIRDLPNMRAESVQVEIDSEHIEGEYILGLISNTTSIGGILHFKEDDVRLNDGYLELLLIPLPSSPWEFTQMIQAVSSQSYSDCSSIVFRRGKNIRIKTKETIAWTIDGEYVEGKEEITIVNIPNAIKVIVPTLIE